MKNTLKEKLAQGTKPLGTFVGTGSAAVVECLGCAGLDFVILDNEHSPIEAETTAELVRAAERRNITPLARVREISRPAILKLLDVGVQGLIIPDVRSAGAHISRLPVCGQALPDLCRERRGRRRAAGAGLRRRGHRAGRHAAHRRCAGADPGLPGVMPPYAGI